MNCDSYIVNFDHARPIALESTDESVVCASWGLPKPRKDVKTSRSQRRSKLNHIYVGCQSVCMIWVTGCALSIMIMIHRWYMHNSPSKTKTSTQSIIHLLHNYTTLLIRAKQRKTVPTPNPKTKLTNTILVPLHRPIPHRNITQPSPPEKQRHSQRDTRNLNSGHLPKNRRRALSSDPI